MSYDERFFDVIDEGCRSSAGVLAPMIFEACGRPRRVIDVGCGRGWWGASFAALGCEVVGIDEYGDGAAIEAHGGHFARHDLRRPFARHLLDRFDMAVCLEVAEHLPASRAPGLVADLCALAPVVAFSAALPGQGGTGHVNEQHLGYWVELFASNDYAVSGALRWKVWENREVENWYCQNLLVCARRPVPKPLASVFRGPLAHPFSVIHPVLWDARR